MRANTKIIFLSNITIGKSLHYVFYYLGCVVASSDGVRQRKHEEKLASVTEKVQEMKRKQMESEKWNSIKRSLLQPINISIGLIVVGGGIFLINYFVNRV